jgi:serine protease AprX
MRNPATLVRLFVVLLLVGTAAPSVNTTLAASPGPVALAKLDPILQRRLSHLTGSSRIIVRAAEGTSLGALASLIEQAGGIPGRAFPLIGARVGQVPDVSLAILAASPLIQNLSIDRPIVGANERTGATIGATTVRQNLGYDGAGVGIAIIDSGVAPSHDDLTAPGGAGRVDHFVDFVNGFDTPYDDYGHGTHVAGIVAGNGFDSSGARSGIAPAAHLMVLKVLDGSGRGHISNVIAALDYAVALKDTFNIRVVNMSVATGVYESYKTDPLTLATESAVKAGIVVVAAGGNNGRDSQGRERHGGVTAPGNAPWVLTVGASSHMGTADRGDDNIAPFSSRGPAAIDYGAKPDLVAPGVGIESLSSPDSAFYSTRASYLLSGTVATSYLPYLSLTGTSMAAPVVTGTVALMIQANPSLTPNEVKAVLQYTAERYSGYDALTQGAGFLNAKGAVELARYLAAPSNVSYPESATWSTRIIWGNRLFRGGQLTHDANAWGTDVVWGAEVTPAGQSVEWGLVCGNSACDSTRGPWRWSLDRGVNVVWGSTCDGLDCDMAWSRSTVTGTTDEGDTVVWGTGDEGDTVVWGTGDEGDTVVWGTTDEGDTVVWGTSCTDPSCEPVIWKSQ